MSDAPVRVEALDHLVLTVADTDATARWYAATLGMDVETFHPADGSTRTALRFGRQKINLHQTGAEFEPKARVAQAGSADLCFLSRNSLEAWADHLRARGVAVEAGPVARTGAEGPIRSLYIRDPDGNLIEIANRA
ncbi:VOC family protein [Jannaschia sp. KMU-145]|uniref:VOC family protein n=1 Tax=Jannaschia halovivens TaxID=3388667 RepID=UPI00396B1A94